MPHDVLAGRLTVLCGVSLLVGTLLSACGQQSAVSVTTSGCYSTRILVTVSNSTSSEVKARVNIPGLFTQQDAMPFTSQDFDVTVPAGQELTWTFSPEARVHFDCSDECTDLEEKTSKDFGKLQGLTNGWDCDRGVELFY